MVSRTMPSLLRRQFPLILIQPCNLHALIIMSHNILVGFPFLRHAVCAVLAHADTVAVALCGDDDVVALLLPCEVGGAQLELCSYVFA